MNKPSNRKLKAALNSIALKPEHSAVAAWRIQNGTEAMKLMQVHTGDQRRSDAKAVMLTTHVAPHLKQNCAIWEVVTSRFQAGGRFRVHKR